MCYRDMFWQAYSDEAMGHMKWFERNRCFRRGRRWKIWKNWHLKKCGIVHLGLFPLSWTVNREFYDDILKRLMADIRRKQQTLRNRNNWILHDNNTPNHRSFPHSCLTKNNPVLLLYQLCSTDLFPADFHLFFKMKMLLKGHRCNTVSEIQS